MIFSPSELDLKPFKLFHFETIDSTSGFLKQYIVDEGQPGYYFCLADKQNAGYGQRARHWHSSLNDLTFSFSLPIPDELPIDSLVIFSPQIAILLHESLDKQVTKPLYLKWPNDLWSNTGKVSGVLIELVQTKKGRCAVIGVGINLSIKADGKYVADYLDTLKVPEFLAELSTKLLSLSEQIVEAKINFNREYWQNHDYFTEHKTVIVYDNDRSYEAIYLGVNELGFLMLSVEGSVITFQSNSISIRPLQK